MYGLRVFCAVLMLGLTVTLSLPAQADGGSWAQAKDYGPVPKSGPIYVEHAQNTALAAWVAEHMEKDLQAKGYHIDPKASLTLRFQTSLHAKTEKHGAFRLNWTDGLGSDERFELGPRYGQPLLEPTEEATWKVGEMVFSLRATVSEVGKAPLWEGEVRRSGRFRDRLAIDAKITKELVGLIGQSVLQAEE